MSKTRKDELESLISLDSPLSEITSSLSDYGWDSSIELVKLAPSHVVSVLGRFLSGALSSKDVEDWANAIESRDDIGYAAPKLLATAVHELANPLLTQPITRQSAQDWTDRLSE